MPTTNTSKTRDEANEDTHDAQHAAQHHPHYTNDCPYTVRDGHNNNNDDDASHDTTLPHWHSCTDYMDAMHRRARHYTMACARQGAALQQLWGGEPDYAIQAEDHATWVLGVWFFSWLGDVMLKAAKEQLPVHALPQPLRSARAYNAGWKLSCILQAQHFREHTWDYLCGFIVTVVHPPAHTRCCLPFHHHYRDSSQPKSNSPSCVTCLRHFTTLHDTASRLVLLLRRLSRALVHGICRSCTKHQSLPNATDVLQGDNNDDEGRQQQQSEKYTEASEAHGCVALTECGAARNVDDDDEYDEENGETSRRGRLGVLCGVGPAMQYGHPDRRYAQVRWLDEEDNSNTTITLQTHNQHSTTIEVVRHTRETENHHPTNISTHLATQRHSSACIRHVNVRQLAFTLPPASLLDPSPLLAQHTQTSLYSGVGGSLPCGAQSDALPACARYTPRSMSVWRALFRAHGHLLLQLVPIRLCRDACTVMVPVVLRMYIQYIESSVSSTTSTGSLSVWRGLGVVLLLTLFLVVQTLCTNKYFHLSYRTAYTMRSALASVIFEKCLRLSSKAAALPAVNAGRIVNLLSNDVTRVEQFTLWCWVSVGAVIQLLSGIAILYYLLGKAAFVSLVVLLLPMPLQKILVGRAFAAFGAKSAATDARLRATNEFLSGIRVVKFMSWEPAFVVGIEEKRRIEIAKMRTLQRLIILVVSTTGAIPQLIIAAVFVTYVTLNTQPLTASIVFPVLSLLTVLQMPLYSVPVVVSSFSQFFVSMRRITRLVECEDAEGLQSMLQTFEAQEEGAEEEEKRKKQEEEGREGRATREKNDVGDGSCSVGEGSSSSSARRVPTQQREYEWADANNGNCTTAEGDVAAYFYRADIAAYEAEKVTLRGRAAHHMERRQARRRAKARRKSEKQSCTSHTHDTRTSGNEKNEKGTSQPAQASSLDTDSNKTQQDTREKEKDKDKEKEEDGVYYTVRPRTVLQNVTLRFPRNGLTVVLGPTGSGKSTLLLSLIGATQVTRGLVGRTNTNKSNDVAYVAQQSWIMNATLRDNIVFFDAVDPTRLAQAIACSQLESDLALLADGLDTEIGEQGVNLSGGQKARVGLARAVYANKALYLLDDPLSALDAHVGQRVMQDCVLGTLRNTTRILATHHEYAAHNADYVVVLGEHGRVLFAGDRVAYAIYNDLHSELPIVAENGANGDAGQKGSSASHVDDDDDTRAASREEDKSSSVDTTTKEEEGETHIAAAAAVHAAGRLMSDEEMATGAVPMAMYKRYAMACGGLRPWLYIFAIHLGTEGLVMAPMLWLSFWSTNAFALPVTTYLYVFLVFSICSIIAEPVRRLTAFPVMLHGSLTLHSQLLRSVAIGTMAFFDSTPLGRLLNRFSKDMDHIDFGQQEQVLALFEFAFSILSSLIIMVYTQPFILIPLLLCGLAYYKLMRLYSAANRTIRRYANLADAPVLASLTTVVAGRWTIAVYGKAADIMRDVLRRLDRVFACNYLQSVGSRWLSVRVSILSNIVVSSIALLGVLTMTYASGGQTLEQRAARVGFISLSLTLGMRIIFMLNEIVELLAQVEANMNCMERIAYYVDNIPHEMDAAVLDEVVAQYAAKIIEVVQQAEAAATIVVERAEEESEGHDAPLAEHSIAAAVVSSNEEEDKEDSAQEVLREGSIQGRTATPANGATAESSNSSSTPAAVVQSAPSSADTKAAALHTTPTTTTTMSSISSPHTVTVSQAGSLEFDHVSMRYRPGLPLVLRDVSFAIAPRQKVGVVGRTGSGKSTLLLTFLRLVNISAGTIRVCGRDAADYRLPALRRLFAMIPQDPVLFEGTVRSNIDPFAEASDDAVRRALELVGITTTPSSSSGNMNSSDNHHLYTQPSVPELPTTASNSGIHVGSASEAAMLINPHTNNVSSATSSNGANALHGSTPAITISTPVQEGGSNFSVGQRQLLCLARALLKRDSAFLLMDEATANVDPLLDRQIQRVVREQFVNYTVITIAHRLHTVAGYDTVLVMQKGQLVEQGSPRELVLRPHSLFREMVIQAAMSPSSAAEYGNNETAGVSGTQGMGEEVEGGMGLGSQFADFVQRRAEQAVEEFLQQCVSQA